MIKIPDYKSGIAGLPSYLCNSMGFAILFFNHFDISKSFLCNSMGVALQMLIIIDYIFLIYSSSIFMLLLDKAYALNFTFDPFFNKKYVLEKGE